MKKVYIPTEEQLYLMQEQGANLYKYLLVKAIETIIMDIKINKNYTGNDKYIINSIKNKLIRENPYIEQAICRLYPEELPHTIYAKRETYLCLALIQEEYKQDNSIYNLDNLSYFDNGQGVLTNNIVVSRTIKTLVDKLPLSPEYRFEYRQSKLLDDIFGCCLSNRFLSIPYSELAKIEPAYLLNKNELIQGLQEKIKLNEYINDYAKRYGIQSFELTEYENKDILTNPDACVKRLIKCIKNK